MKRIAILALLLVPCLLNQSCKKEDNEKESSATAQLGIQVKDALDLYEVNERQSISIEVAVTADPTSAEGYTITIGASPALVASYNAAHGTSYEMLPAEAYSFSTTSVMLPRYSAKSTWCELRLKGMGCEPEQVYLLPVAINGVKGGTNFEAPDEKAAYILFKVLPTVEEEGKGTKESPYTIKSVEDILKMDSMLLDDETTYFKMTDDVDFTGTEFTGEGEWTPVNYATTDEAVAIAEKRVIDFDGNGHTIRNFKTGGALFGTLVGKVRNLTFENADVVCVLANTGGILAGNAGVTDNAESVLVKNVKIKNSHLNSVYQRTGGLIGWLKAGTIEDVEVDCTVEADRQVGGLIGRVESGTLVNCSASGDVSAEGYYSGGLVGIAKDITIRNSHASGSVTHLPDGGNYSRIGGLVGQIDGDATIEKCYATGNITGTGHYGGGLIGLAGADEKTVSISRCYATGDLNMPTGANWAHAGGLLGSLIGAGTVNIDNCYATGTIVCERYSSGFVGSIYGVNATLHITNSYTTSDVSGINRLFGVVLGMKSGKEGGSPVVTCTGFVAWNVSGKPFCNPEDAVPLAGNYYGTEGTVSQQATALGWSADIWDLSENEPKLK